ncbi:1-phosphatidylinositol phosphodiesterase-like [Cotesia glomerata]|uniref:1-phosphatidylinositol phosphodiesterase-like n=1 Tax=Cotesia glomerata TaxID=32391 RepID=UPI001D0145BD|nr:1-phosphatidylinositol phosphodiesterase-like [Cotesia glomerata]
MKTKFEALPIVILGILSGFARACNPPLISQGHKNFFSRLPGAQKLNTLALIGTHNSATYKSPLPIAQTQSLTITQQLHFGIRVFDIRVRRIDNVFTIHHDLMYMELAFGNIINDVISFLESYPQELVIMFMQEEYVAENSNMNECEILLNKYILQHNNQKYFVQNWSVEDTIEKHRGKILLASSHRGFWQCTTKLPCREQNEWKLSSSFTLYHKWRAIIYLQHAINISNPKSLCYINYLSAHSVIMSPYEIANYPHQSSVNRKRFIQPSINQGMSEFFCNYGNVLYIVMADYPTTELIDTIVNSNFSPFLC